MFKKTIKSANAVIGELDEELIKSKLSNIIWIVSESVKKIDVVVGDDASEVSLRLASELDKFAIVERSEELEVKMKEEFLKETLIFKDKLLRMFKKENKQGERLDEIVAKARHVDKFEFETIVDEMMNLLSGVKRR